MYRARLAKEGAEPFKEFLEQAWEWPRPESISFPAWPYVGPEYGDEAKLLIVGKAHDKWPSKIVGHSDRPETQELGPDDSFAEFKSRFSPTRTDDVIATLEAMNDEFIEGVREGLFSSPFWNFVRRLLSRMDTDLRGFAWTNTFPFCKASQGLPEEELIERQESFRPFVGRTVEILDADHVVVLGSGNWQRHTEAAISANWESLPAPQADGKSSSWYRARLPTGGTAIRCWHPQWAPFDEFEEGLIEALDLQAGDR